jgi:hypothetical protein
MVECKTVVITMSPGTIKRRHCSGNGKDKLEQLREKQDLPAEKYSYLLFRFYDTYTYYINT